MIDAIEIAGEWFIGLFQAGADFFLAVAELLPLILILLVFFNTIIALVGQERVDRFSAFAGRPGWVYAPLRFLVLPVVAVLFLTNPMAYMAGKFLPERNKPAFYDSAVSFVHPVLPFFPHANAHELFVWLGIARGVQELGLSMTELGVRYILVGLVVILLRGIVTQIIYDVMSGRRRAGQAEPAPAGGEV